MPSQWLVRIDDKDYPAQSIDELRSWAREGKVLSSHYVFNPTLEKWLYAREVEELKGLIGGSAHRGSHACTSCGFVGSPITQTKGTFLMELILWLCCLIPGLIYSIWRLTSRERVCPNCHHATMIPASSPQGQKLLAADQHGR